MKLMMVRDDRTGCELQEHYAIANVNIRRRICGTWRPRPPAERIWEGPHCHVEPGDIVLDVGADIWIFAIHAGREGAAQYIGFEPNPANFECLSYNAKLGRPGFDKHIRLFDYAVADCGRTAPFYTGNGITAHGLIDLHDGETIHFVRVVTLDWLFGQGWFDHIDMLKVDCNSSEVAVFDGLSPSNLAKIRKISIQYHHYVETFRPEWFYDIQRRLRGAGYETEVKGINNWGDAVILAWRKP